MDQPVVVISIYRSPQSPMKEFFFEFDQVVSKIDNSDQLIITGDFNVDLFVRSPERDTFMKYYSNTCFKQVLSGVSTNYGSQLDCVFTKNLTCSCSLYESYFSDHKPMLISLGMAVNDSSIRNIETIMGVNPGGDGGDASPPLFGVGGTPILIVPPTFCQGWIQV